jgi:hypothetical protein
MESKKYQAYEHSLNHLRNTEAINNLVLGIPESPQYHADVIQELLDSYKKLKAPTLSSIDLPYLSKLCSILYNKPTLYSSYDEKGHTYITDGARVYLVIKDNKIIRFAQPESFDLPYFKELLAYFIYEVEVKMSKEV